MTSISSDKFFWDNFKIRKMALYNDSLFWILKLVLSEINEIRLMLILSNACFHELISIVKCKTSFESLVKVLSFESLVEVLSGSEKATIQVWRHQRIKIKILMLNPGQSHFFICLAPEEAIIYEFHNI